jgi:hypothetical protein
VEDPYLVAIYEGPDGAQSRRSQLDLDLYIGVTPDGKPYWGGKGFYSRFTNQVYISEGHYLLIVGGDESYTIDLALHVMMQGGRIVAKPSTPSNAQMMAKAFSEAEWMQVKVVTSPNLEKFKVLVNLLGEASSDVMKQTEASQDVEDFKNEQASNVKDSLLDTIKSTVSQQVSSTITTQIDSVLKTAIEQAIRTVTEEITNAVEKNKQDILDAVEREVESQCEDLVNTAVHNATANTMNKYQESVKRMMNAVVEAQLTVAQSQLSYLSTMPIIH